MRVPRPFRHRPPIRLALVGLVVLLTALTGIAIGGLAWREQRARSRTLIDAAMAQAARLTVAHAGVRCAWAMQAAMGAVNAESRALGVPPLSMGIGLHIGAVVAGNIGSPERLKYGVVGPAVNLVSRIQSLTAAGEVLLSDALAIRVSAIASVGPPESSA